LQNFLSSAISIKKEVVYVTTSGDLIKSNLSDGGALWSVSTLESTMAHASDFFKSSEIVIDGDIIIFSAKSSIFSFNLNSGYMNWKRNVSSVGAPIIDGKNIFIQTENGYFVILDKETGSILSSTNILKILKTSKQQTFITGFVMGSEKIYSTTSNGYLIIASPITGKVESFIQIGNPVFAAPIISNGKLYILTQKSHLFVFN
jgi:outer membrane protein assembly factor BamB